MTTAATLGSVSSMGEVVSGDAPDELIDCLMSATELCPTVGGTLGVGTIVTPTNPFDLINFLCRTGTGSVTSQGGVIVGTGVSQLDA